MIGIVVALISVALPVRADFVRRVALLRKGDAIAQVKRALGPPDQILGDDHPESYLGRTIWKYGISGLGQVATLAEIHFESETMVFTAGSRSVAPPSSSVISERELRSLIEVLDVPLKVHSDNPTLWLVRAGNALIAAGKTKAIAALQEYEQVLGPGHDMRFHLLVRTIFDPPAKPGYFPLALIGDTLRAKDRQNTARHPIILMDDVPISVYRPGMIAGAIPTITQELRTFRNYPFRTKLLRPPANPFLTYRRMVRSRFWPFPSGLAKGGRFAYSEGQALKGILELVQDAYRPVEMDDRFPRISGLDSAKYEKEFLATGAHWDAKRQRYVPAKGGLVLDHNPSQAIPVLKVSDGGSTFRVRFRRLGPDVVEYTHWIRWSGRGGPKPFFIVIRNQASKPLNFIPGATEAYIKQRRDRELADIGFTSFDGHCFRLPAGKEATIEIYYGVSNVERQVIKL